MIREGLAYKDLGPGTEGARLPSVERSQVSYRNDLA
jgi:hypothetical protein